MSALRGHSGSLGRKAMLVASRPCPRGRAAAASALRRVGGEPVPFTPKSFRPGKDFYGYHRKKPSQVMKSSGSSVGQVMAVPRGAGDAGGLAVIDVVAISRSAPEPRLR